jgi:serine/threonine protein kinase
MALSGMSDMSESEDLGEIIPVSDISEDVDPYPITTKASPPHIEGYEILGRLGKGGMGTVWRAIQLSTKREVAVKLLEGRRLTSDRSRVRFEREVMLSAQLTHPNIARVYDSGLLRGQYYYVMELVEGVHLEKYVRSRKLDPLAILCLMYKVCRAIEFAHDLGIVHRDLKPSNILVTPDGEPHVLDFGLAKACDSDDWSVTVSLEGEIVGTPAYMSPEQAAGCLKDIDERTDVYSLGVILYQLLTGHLPHDMSGTKYEVLKRVIEEEITDPCIEAKPIDAKLGSLLRKACAKKVKDRFKSVRQLGDSIFEWIECQQASLDPISSHRSLSRSELEGYSKNGDATDMASLSLEYHGRSMNLVLLAKASIRIGRRKTYDLVARILPSNKHNDQQSLRIASSKPQCVIDLFQDGVYIRDLNSRNGTLLDDKAVDATGRQVQHHHHTLSLANVLDLHIRCLKNVSSLDISDYEDVSCDDKGTLWATASASDINALVLRRINNLGNEDANGCEHYCVVYRMATIGSSDGDALCFSDKGLEPCHAALLYVKDRFYLVNLCSGMNVKINGQPLGKGRVTPLNFGDRIQIAELDMEFRRKHQLYID